eukprot:CAMPEP_0202691170 /NCGR_PEP_ID=MMETSP1385-20130828/5958_1 /ASSEMBLY_ACC=CAM_ASM_000861 /TAXON_ID=933848 /ORGANISM="Elphidium margaritaceum" /LENGTH=427 /DNA_ID=CAMNT_0049346531 /DNA_START=105 /DNA_END=1385 /DNA_ORIENTATION=+
MYCTLPCYKQHDAECTNQFYSAHVMDTIRNERATKQESIDMAKKLKAFYDARMKEDEDRDAALLRQKLDNERLNENLDKLQQLAIEDAIDINDLTQYQQQQFATALKNGKVSQHIAVWTPWWSPDGGGNRTIIMEENEIEEDEIEEAAGSNHNISLIVPSLPVDIPSFESMNAKPPSPLLPFLLCDILCAYVAAMITYNGDWREEPSQVLQLILSVSNVLQLNNNATCTQQCVYHDFAAVTNALMQRCAAQSVKHNKLEILLYLKQVCVLLTKKMNVLRALNQMYELIVIIQHEIVQKSKVSKTLQKKMKQTHAKKEKAPTDSGVMDANDHENYFDAHADQFMQLMNADNDNNEKRNTEMENKTKPSSSSSYSSSFAPEKVRKNVKKKCKSLDILKRKLWYYLVYCHQFISDEKANLLSAELKITVE